MTKQFLLFLLSGGLAAFFNWASRFIFSIWMPFELAVVASFLVGLGSGFLMMRFYVFDGIRKPVVPQASMYTVINMLALVQTLVISSIFARSVLPYLGVVSNTEAIAHLIGILVPVMTSYIGHKYWSFR